MRQREYPDFITGLCDSSRTTADIAVKAVSDNVEYFKKLVDISFNEKYPVNMRASRVVQLCCERNVQLIMPFIDEIIPKLSQANVSGVKRNFLKLINEFVGPQNLKDPGMLVKICFDWLMSNNEATAVRFHCMEILFKISLIETDLSGELLSVLEYLSEEGYNSQSLKNCAKKTIGLLRKQSVISNI